MLKIATEATAAASAPRHRYTGWSVRMSTAGERERDRGNSSKFQIRSAGRNKAPSCFRLLPRVVLDNSPGISSIERHRTILTRRILEKDLSRPTSLANSVLFPSDLIAHGPSHQTKVDLPRHGESVCFANSRILYSVELSSSKVSQEIPRPSTSFYSRN